MRVIAFSKNGAMLKIGEDEKTAKWYFLTDAVRDYVSKNIKRGDNVDIRYDTNDGKYTITYISKNGGATQPKTTTKSSKSKEERDEITKMSVLRAVCSAIVTLQGQVDINTLGDVIEELYDRFLQKIKE